MKGWVLATATGLLLVSSASAQNHAEPPSTMRQGLDTGGRIVVQPVHDVDARRTTIPSVLQAARRCRR